MSGRKLWQEKHTSYCFDKFTTDTPGEGQVDVWYLPRDANGTLVLPKAQRGQGDDPIKLGLRRRKWMIRNYGAPP
jgi:hypothetical protein